MKKLLFLLFIPLFLCAANAADEKFQTCGAGYILASHAKFDGITGYECQKLWCRDLETGRSMGDGNSAASGYKTTGGAVQLCDAENNCIECFGDRKWCAGEAAGLWNPEYGAYTRGGGDNASYISYLKGSCYAWRLEKPSCEAGETAVLKNGEWLCASSTGSTSNVNRGSSIRRTGSIRIR